VRATNSCGWRDASAVLSSNSQPKYWRFCACGCRRRTPLGFDGKPLLYLHPSHNPKYRPRKAARQRDRPRTEAAPNIPVAVPASRPHDSTDRLSHVLTWTNANQKLLIAQRKRLEARQRAAAKRYVANRRHVSVGFRVLQNLRGRLRAALKGAGKTKRTLHLVGCTIPELRAHLEKQFKPGMSWDNYGQWHVDHRVACQSFDLTKPDEQRRCFHYTNLQPLWADDNFKKGQRCHS